MLPGWGLGVLSWMQKHDTPQKLPATMVLPAAYAWGPKEDIGTFVELGVLCVGCTLGFLGGLGGSGQYTNCK